MQSFEIIERIRHGEDSVTQFKQDISDARSSAYRGSIRRTNSYDREAAYYRKFTGS